MTRQDDSVKPSPPVKLVDGITRSFFTQLAHDTSTLSVAREPTAIDKRGKIVGRSVSCHETQTCQQVPTPCLSSVRRCVPPGPHVFGTTRRRPDRGLVS
jgi:hypothetical protein